MHVSSAVSSSRATRRARDIEAIHYGEPITENNPVKARRGFLQPIIDGYWGGVPDGYTVVYAFCEGRKLDNVFLIVPDDSGEV